MEVKETNNLLQQLFNVRTGNTPVTADNGLFAEMLNTPADEIPAAKKDDAFIGRDQAVRTAKSKDSQELPLKEDKQPVKEKEAPAGSEHKKKDNKVKEKDRPETTDAPAQVNENNSPKHKDGQPEPAADETVTTARETAAPAGQTVSSEAVSAMPAVVVSEGQTVLNLLPPAEGGDMPELQAANGIVLSQDTAQTTAAADDVMQLPAQPLTKEDALLFEQARLLDDKLASVDKVKIDVTVNEAKIADPLTKDVLQNRFEIDSLFRTVDAETAALPPENIDDAAPVLTISPATRPAMQDQGGVLFNPAAQAVVTPEVSPDGEKAAVTDNTVLAVSGKEVVAETQNALRGEAFARINETSARDNVKGMAKEVVEQIKVNITKSAVKGVDTIDIQLKPEDLGQIRIKMHIARDGRLQAEIISGRPETLDLLQKDISGLEKAFNDAGYDTDSRSFNFSFQEENQAGKQQENDSGLLQFIGDTLEQEAGDIAGNDNLVYDPLKGLNIKV